MKNRHVVCVLLVLMVFLVACEKHSTLPLPGFDPEPDGVPCWDTNGNGVKDIEEDVVIDGVIDELDCIDPTCPDDTPYRCIDGTCVVHPGACALTSELCPDWAIECLDTTCVSTKEECEFLTDAYNRLLKGVRGSCPEILCWDGSCAETEQECPKLCLPGTVLCPDEERCALSLEFCQNGTACPPEKSMLCSDGSCVTSLEECIEVLQG